MKVKKCKRKSCKEVVASLVRYSGQQKALSLDLERQLKELKDSKENARITINAQIGLQQAIAQIVDAAAHALLRDTRH